ncbi:MAG: hypothetical protein METHP_00078 [Methanoregula sp. SKADARSKE-2]|nr:MAG: hypothetical protein METHP_00078 [Methanoregula sp. SKADARSKE-2]
MLELVICMKKIGAVHFKLFACTAPAGIILSSIVAGILTWPDFLFHNLFMTWSKTR